MISLAKMVADAAAGHVVHIAGALGAILLASEAYRTLAAAAAPIAAALN